MTDEYLKGVVRFKLTKLRIQIYLGVELGIAGTVIALHKVTNCLPSRTVWKDWPKSVIAAYTKGSNFIIYISSRSGHVKP